MHHRGNKQSPAGEVDDVGLGRSQQTILERVKPKIESTSSSAGWPPDQLKSTISQILSQTCVRSKQTYLTVDRIMINFDDYVASGEKNVVTGEGIRDRQAFSSEDKSSMSYSTMAFLVRLLNLQVPSNMWVKVCNLQKIAWCSHG